MELDHELAALLSRSLTLDPSMSPELRRSIEHELQAKTIVYSASQHYHHSSHHSTVPDFNPGTSFRSASEPLARPTCEVLLRQNGIDPSALLPPQLQLFRIAGTEQQDRLLALWRICPPNKNVGDDPSLAWTATTLEQEEHRTKERLLQKHCQQVVRDLEQQQQQQQQMAVMSLDGTPIQSPDGSWGPSIHDAQSDSEPYMTEGYMQLMQGYGYDPETQNPASCSPATDPVYRSAGWHGCGPAGVHMEQMDVAM